MTTPYLGEIQILSFNFAPVGWALCNGALLPIRQYTALFSLIGTTYGGDGRQTFALPNLMGAAPCGTGQGPGLTQRNLGGTFGSQTVALTQSTMPAHTHAMSLFVQTDSTKRVGLPAANYGILPPGQTLPFVSGAPANAPFAAGTIGPAGGNLPHENRQPFLALNYCIALQGDFPQF
ncbi:phage tail protein [Dyella caseinilytica]|uniref:Phage tail protein n=1 Tax=Dyella caseinilytica TaxID=1849581 RepID=A0ABX7GTE8_9GAMM|nr:tail fiber protein [Dyella caseinilytica]QRN53687.1 phage tail protein [Dyella caseinilytica]GFZ88518.1 microcystin dependent protein [Dyella caseinilytica]